LDGGGRSLFGAAAWEGRPRSGTIGRSRCFAAGSRAAPCDRAPHRRIARVTAESRASPWHRAVHGERRDFRL